MVTRLTQMLRLAPVMVTFCPQQTSVGLKRLLEGMRVLRKNITPVRLAFFLTPVTIGAASIKPKNPDDIHTFLKLVDDLDATYRHEDEYTTLENRLTDKIESCDNPELLWRMARAGFQLAQKPDTGKQQRRKLLEESLTLIHRSLELNADNPNAHVWCALITEASVMYRSIEEQIQSAGITRKHLDCALRFKPQDALVHFSVAVWCYHLAKLNWFERNMAKLICPSFPTATWEEAMKHFEKADRLSPHAAGWRHLLVGVKCCIKLGETDKARILLRRALTIPVRTRDDVVAFKEGTNLMKSLQMQEQ